MQESQIIQYAMELRESHGDNAEAEAARKAEEFRKGGDHEQAKVWEKIRDAIFELQGPPFELNLATLSDRPSGMGFGPDRAKPVWSRGIVSPGYD